MTVEKLWRRSLARGPVRAALFPLLLFVALLFHAARFCKFWIFRLGLFPRTRVSALTVSIGNIAIGGTGKTPFVAAVARILSEEMGVDTAVLCRGYGSRNRDWVRFVSTRGTLAPDAAMGGDEAFLLARSLTKASVIVGRRRALTARAAVEARHAAVVLDDGFQYWRLERDIDIVCFGAGTAAEFFRPFPVGVLREPLERLAACDFVALPAASADGDGAALAELEREVRRLAPRAGLLRTRFAADGLSELGRLEVAELPGELASCRVVAISNIADPGPFHRLLESHGAVLVAAIECDDHHVHTARTWRDAAELAEKHRATRVVVTEKDEPSLLEAGPPGLPPGVFVRVLRGHVELDGPGGEALRRALRARMRPA